MHIIKKTIFSAFFMSVPFTFFSQAHISTQAHQSAITDISFISSGSSGTVFSSGNDGFLIKWLPDGIGEHYQVSEMNIKMIARHPNGNEIAIYETDGGTLNRVTIWDWKKFSKKHSFRFDDSITSLEYSAKGTFLICGSATESGTVFINTATGSVVPKKIKENVGITSYISTSQTENSLMLYSSRGTISYFNLKNGERKAKFEAESNLNQLNSFNNSLFLAGTKEKNIFIVQATTGKTIEKFSADSPVIVHGETLQDLYYITNEKLQFKLYKIACTGNKSVSAPELIRTFSGIKSGEKIVKATFSNNEIYAGTSIGNIYTFDYAPSERVDSLLAITDNMYDHIYDVSSFGDEFIFLTPGAIYQSSYDSSVVDKKAINPGYKNLVEYGNGAILWTKDSRKTVSKIDFATGITTEIFSPSGAIQNIRLSGDYIISIEANAYVNRYNITTGKKEQLYKGSSIQDAILKNDTDLYVAKTSAVGLMTPLIYVNIKTQETVPLSVKGDIAYALNYDDTVTNSEIFGITVDSDATTRKITTSVFAYNPATKTSRQIITSSEEDNDAVLCMKNSILYTNVGKSQVRSYNLKNHRTLNYKRSASMPLKAARNSNRMAILNRDGSISWYNPDLGNVLADWYLTTDESWFEF